MAYASGAENESEHLAVAVEVRADLIKDMEVFCKYVLKSIDQQIIEIVGKHFQITPSERLYLEPGTIAKTSSGKIKHMRNRQTFAEKYFDGLLERLVISQDEEDSETDETKPSLKNEIVALFKKVVSLNPDMPKAWIKLIGLLERNSEEYKTYYSLYKKNRSTLAQEK